MAVPFAIGRHQAEHWPPDRFALSNRPAPPGEGGHHGDYSPVSPTPFRRHPLRRLRHYLGLAALYGILAGLAWQTFITGHTSLAFGFACASAAALLVFIGLVIQERRFHIVITRDRIIIDNGYPFGSRHVIERIYIRGYYCPPNPIGHWFDTGTLVIEYGDETIVLDGLTPFSTLRELLEVL